MSLNAPLTKKTTKIYFSSLLN